METLPPDLYRTAPVNRTLVKGKSLKRENPIFKPTLRVDVKVTEDSHYLFQLSGGFLIDQGDR